MKVTIRRFHETIPSSIGLPRCTRYNIQYSSQHTGGPIGACQTTSDGKAFNMGYVQAMPEAAIDGSLSLRYVNGDICHKKYHRSTRINFECSSTPVSCIF